MVLLHDVGQLVCQQAPAARGDGVIATCREVQLTADGEGAGGADPGDRRSCRRIGVNSHATEVMLESTFHLHARGWLERLDRQV